VNAEPMPPRPWAGGGAVVVDVVAAEAVAPIRARTSSGVIALARRAAVSHGHGHGRSTIGCITACEDRRVLPAQEIAGLRRFGRLGRRSYHGR